MELVLQKADSFVNSIGFSVTQPHYQSAEPIEWLGHEANLSCALKTFEREFLTSESVGSDPTS